MALTNVRPGVDQVLSQRKQGINGISGRPIVTVNSLFGLHGGQGLGQLTVPASQLPFSVFSPDLVQAKVDASMNYYAARKLYGDFAPETQAALANWNAYRAESYEMPYAPAEPSYGPGVSQSMYEAGIRSQIQDSNTNIPTYYTVSPQTTASLVPTAIPIETDITIPPPSITSTPQAPPVNTTTPTTTTVTSPVTTTVPPTTPSGPTTTAPVTPSTLETDGFFSNLTQDVRDWLGGFYDDALSVAEGAGPDTWIEGIPNWAVVGVPLGLMGLYFMTRGVGDTSTSRRRRY